MRRSDLVRISLVSLFCICFIGGGKTQQTIPADVDALLIKYLCVTCHKLNEKLIGPSYIELAQKSRNVKEISALIVEPQPSNWPGYPSMAPMPHLPKQDVKKIATWIATLGNENENQN